MSQMQKLSLGPEQKLAEHEWCQCLLPAFSSLEIKEFLKSRDEWGTEKENVRKKKRKKIFQLEELQTAGLEEGEGGCGPLSPEL